MKDSLVKVDVDVQKIGRYLNKAKKSINSALNTLPEGKGMNSKSVAVLMMAYGSAVSTANIIAAINEEISHKSNKEMEEIWKEIEQVCITAQAASQMIEDVAEKLDLGEAITFRDVRSERIDQLHFKKVLSDYVEFKNLFNNLEDSELS